MTRLLFASFLLTVSVDVSTAQITNYNQNTNIPVTQNGNPLKNPWVGGMNSMQFSRIDLNDDGLEDLFGFDRTCDRIVTYLNQGTPGNIDFVYAPQYESKFPVLQSWVLLVDYNGDGKRDIFTYYPGGATCFRNNSSVGSGLQFVPAEGLSQYNLINSYQPPNTNNINIDGNDIPAIVDVDNDGDIDILTFGQYGSQMEYHKNLSMETYGIPDSLYYHRKNRCWGRFIESSATNNVALDSCNPFIPNDPNPEFGHDPHHAQGNGADGRNERHAGSTVLALDMTGDGVKELLLGDVSFTNLVALYNAGPTVNSNSPMISKDTVFPDYDISTDLWLFPAAFYEDMDNDGVRDLLVSPNTNNQSEDKHSVWYYHNDGNDSVPDFRYLKDDFLQEEMIDVGIVSKPVMFDYDNDGLQDLFVGNLGSYNRASNTYKTSISLYRNIGTATAPAFELITSDYENISSMGFPVGVHPTFGDLDGDGDKDMLIGDAEGNLHYFENQPGVGGVANFVLNMAYYEDASHIIIDVGYDAAPFLADMDRDSDLDLLIGTKDGKIVYFENLGNSTTPAFNMVTATFGDVNVKTIFDQYGYATPCVYDNNGSYELYVGSNRGTIYHYDNIENNLGGTFTKLDTAFQGINTGRRSCPLVYDFNGDDVPEIINGNYRGGLAFFDSNPGIGITGPGLVSSDVKIYPNPASDMVNIRIKNDRYPLNYSIYDLSGKIIETGILSSGANSIDVKPYTAGYYAIRLSKENTNIVLPLIVVR